MSVKSSRASSHITSCIDTDVSRVLKVVRQTESVEWLWSRWLLSPGPRPRETPGGSDGWRTATAPRHCWTWVCVGCPLDGGNWQAPRTRRETLEKGAALHAERKRQTGCKTQKNHYFFFTRFFFGYFFLLAASSSSPEDVGVAAGVGIASSSVLHLLTLPNVILAFSTWNSGISARQEGATRSDSCSAAVAKPWGFSFSFSRS